MKELFGLWDDEEEEKKRCERGVRSGSKHWRVDAKKWKLGAVDVSAIL